jgi:hypothetical protein
VNSVQAPLGGWQDLWVYSSGPFDSLIFSTCIKYEIVQGPCAHLGLHERPYVDRLNVISSGSIVMKIDAKVCFPRGPSSSNIWSPIGSKFGINVARDPKCYPTGEVTIGLECSRWVCKNFERNILSTFTFSCKSLVFNRVTQISLLLAFCTVG